MNEQQIKAFIDYYINENHQQLNTGTILNSVLKEIVNYAKALGDNTGNFTHYVGELFGGGIVFAVWKDQNKEEHGLITSFGDIGNDYWSNIVDSTGGSAYNFTDGSSNTTGIISQVGHTGSAAQICRDFDGGDFTDWYLPAAWELLTLFQNSTILEKVLQIPVFRPDSSYWSSTETLLDGTKATIFIPAVNSFDTVSKSNALQIRAIRQF